MDGRAKVSIKYFELFSAPLVFDADHNAVWAKHIRPGMSFAKKFRIISESDVIPKLPTQFPQERRNTPSRCPRGYCRFDYNGSELFTIAAVQHRFERCQYM